MKKNYSSGFTLTELMIVLAIIGLLFSLSGINLLGAYSKNTLNTTLTTTQADLKQQQLKQSSTSPSRDTRKWEIFLR